MTLRHRALHPPVVQVAILHIMFPSGRRNKTARYFGLIVYGEKQRLRSTATIIRFEQLLIGNSSPPLPRPFGPSAFLPVLGKSQGGSPGFPEVQTLTLSNGEQFTEEQEGVNVRWKRYLLMQKKSRSCHTNTKPTNYRRISGGDQGFVSTEARGTIS